MIVKFTTLNLEHGGALIQKVADFIRQEKPDILFVQEAYAKTDLNSEDRLRSMSILQQASGLEYSAFAASFFDLEVNEDRGNGILTRYPITSEESIVFVSPYRKLREIELDPDYRTTPRILMNINVTIHDKEVKLLNIHGAWDFHGEDTPARLEQSKLVLEKIGDNERVILAGDFNMFPKTKAIRMIENRLVNVFSPELKTTFNMKRKNAGNFSRSVVDMVFVSRSIRVLEKDCPDVDISDHLPLVVTLEI